MAFFRLTGVFVMVKVPESGSDSHRLRRLFLTLIPCLLIPLSGCEEVKKAVNKAKSEVSGSATAETPPVAPANAALQTMPSVTVPATPVVGPTPAEIVARFQKLPPYEITDADLTELSVTPEAGLSIQKIDLTGNRHVSNAGLAQLATLKNLTSLTLTSTDLTPENLSAIGSIQSLNELTLSSTKTDDAVVAKLTAIPHLKALDLSGTLITPAAGKSLSQMMELTVLKLGSTAANDQLVTMLHNLPLMELRLEKTQITGAAIPEILKIKTLEHLGVDLNNIPGIAWKGASRANLKTLSVGQTPFGLEGFQAIKGMDSLESLNVYAAGLVEHKSADVFGSFPKLRILNAGSNAVTDVGMVEFFKGLKNIEELHLGSNRNVSDRGLAALIGLKKLRFLDVNDTNCGQAGALTLKEKLPECKIKTSSGEY